MKPYIAIMEWDVGNRVAKFQDFDTENEASNHVQKHSINYPLAFVSPKPNDSFVSWLIDNVTKQINIDFPVTPISTNEERIDSVFPQTDSASVIFGLFFEIINDIRALKGQSVMTKDEFKTFLKNKLP